MSYRNFVYNFFEMSNYISKTVKFSSQASSKIWSALTRDRQKQIKKIVDHYFFSDPQHLNWFDEMSRSSNLNSVLIVRKLQQLFHCWLFAFGLVTSSFPGHFTLCVLVNAKNDRHEDNFFCLLAVKNGCPLLSYKKADEGWPSSTL